MPSVVLVAIAVFAMLFGVINVAENICEMERKVGWLCIDISIICIVWILISVISTKRIEITQTFEVNGVGHQQFIVYKNKPYNITTNLNIFSKNKKIELTKVEYTNTFGINW